MEYQLENYLLSDDKSLLSYEIIFELLGETYWAKGRTMGQIRKSIEQSIAYGLYYDNQQIGFARIVTDYATMYYLCDVVIARDFRNKGLGFFMVKSLITHYDNQGLKGILLTRDAHNFYNKLGFSIPQHLTVMLK